MTIPWAVVASSVSSIPGKFNDFKEDISEVFDYLPNGRIPTPYGMLPNKVVDDFGGRTAHTFRVASRGDIKENVSVLNLEGMKADEYNKTYTRPWTDIFNLRPNMFTAGTVRITKEQDDGSIANVSGFGVRGPFSLYYPSALWPHMTEEGKRYTVMDLADEDIESDWMGLKPWAEWATDVKYDKVGALPGFRFWGDASLGATAIAPLVIVAIPIGLSVWAWGPTVGKRILDSWKEAFKGTLEYTFTVGKRVRGMFSPKEYKFEDITGGKAITFGGKGRKVEKSMKRLLKEKDEEIKVLSKELYGKK